MNRKSRYWVWNSPENRLHHVAVLEYRPMGGGNVRAFWHLETGQIKDMGPALDVEFLKSAGTMLEVDHQTADAVVRDYLRTRMESI